eukprot:774316-Amphidinium_carterae.1
MACRRSCFDSWICSEQPLSPSSTQSPRHRQPAVKPETFPVQCCPKTMLKSTAHACKAFVPQFSVDVVDVRRFSSTWPSTHALQQVPMSLGPCACNG